MKQNAALNPPRHVTTRKPNSLDLTLRLVDAWDRVPAGKKRETLDRFKAWIADGCKLDADGHALIPASRS